MLTISASIFLTSLVITSSLLATPSLARSGTLIKSIRNLFFHSTPEGEALVRTLSEKGQRVPITFDDALSVTQRLYHPQGEDVFHLYGSLRSEIDLGLSEIEDAILHARAAERPITKLTPAELAADLTESEMALAGLLIHNRFRINQGRVEKLIREASVWAEDLGPGIASAQERSALREVLSRRQYKLFDEDLGTILASGKHKEGYFFRQPRPFMYWDPPTLPLTPAQAKRQMAEMDSLIRSMNRCLRTRTPDVASADNRYYIMFDMARNSAFTTFGVMFSDSDKTLLERLAVLPVDLGMTFFSTYFGTMVQANEVKLMQRFLKSAGFGQVRSGVDAGVVTLKEFAAEGAISDDFRIYAMKRFSYNSIWNNLSNPIPVARFWLISGMKCLFPHSKIVYWGSQVMNIGISLGSNHVYYSLRDQELHDLEKMLRNPDRIKDDALPPHAQHP